MTFHCAPSSGEKGLFILIEKSIHCRWTVSSQGVLLFWKDSNNQTTFIDFQGVFLLHQGHDELTLPYSRSWSSGWGGLRWSRRTQSWYLQTDRQRGRQVVQAALHWQWIQFASGEWMCVCVFWFCLRGTTDILNGQPQYVKQLGAVSS